MALELAFFVCVWILIKNFKTGKTCEPAFCNQIPKTKLLIRQTELLKSVQTGPAARYTHARGPPTNKVCRSAYHPIQSIPEPTHTHTHKTFYGQAQN
jgi:hypothetical protein